MPKNCAVFYSDRYVARCLGTWRGVLFRLKGTWRGVFLSIVIVGTIFDHSSTEIFLLHVCPQVVILDQSNIALFALKI